MANLTYQAEVDRKCLEQLQDVLKELPPLCKDYFSERRTNTSTRTRLGYARDIKMFFSWLVSADERFFDKLPKDISIEDFKLVSSREIEDFIAFLQTDERHLNSNFAVARKMSALSSLWNYYCKRREDIKNPVSVVTPPKIHTVEIIRLEPNETVRLLDAIESPQSHFPERQAKYLSATTTRDLAIVGLLLGTGIRVSECVGLNISDVHLDECKISVRRKGGNMGIAALSDEVIDLLRDYIAEREGVDAGDALFLSLQKKRINVQTLENMLRKYAKAAGINKNITPHKLRKTFGTELYRATGDIYLVAEALDHNDVATTTRHYAAQTEDNLLAARDKVVLRGKQLKKEEETE